MPVQLRYFPPTQPEDFERLCLKLLRRHWSRPGLQLFGKRGEKQFGVDIIDSWSTQPYVGAQCKLKEPHKALSGKEIRVEVERAKGLPLRLDQYTILTTARVAAQSQLDVLEINGTHRALGLFIVDVIYWDQICELLMQYPDVAIDFYGSLFAPSLKATGVRSSMTIVVPVHNEAARLRKLMTSLKGQGWTDRYQVLVCDDGSTDKSYELLQDLCAELHLSQVICTRLPFNSRKVGAIHRMLEAVQTPFTLTLDADSMLTECRRDAIEELIVRMTAEGYAATCFRIDPEPTNLLGRLQVIDYSIFTDTLRRLLGVPVCLIGQGVLWNTASLRQVLTTHSGEYHGDDLENTVIALGEGMRLHWEPDAAVLTTATKETPWSLLRQRGLSWDFGMFRVLSMKGALRIKGESGAFYKNLLLTELFAHPFRLMAIPVLCPAFFFWLMGPELPDGIVYRAYARSVAISFEYGSFAISLIWIATVVNSAVCVRRLRSVLKWSLVNAVYLTSPFVYLMYYSLVRRTGANPFDVAGSAVYWLGLGLLLTYVWWLLLTTALFWSSSLSTQKKVRLSHCLILSPAYFFSLLLIGRTLGIWRYAKHSLSARMRGRGE